MMDIELGSRARGFLTVMTLAGVMLAAVMAWQCSRTSVEQHRIFRMAVVHGYPTTLEQLDAWYAPVPPDENAALGYVLAGAHLPGLYDLGETWPSLDQPMPDDQRRRVAGRLVQHSEALTLIHQAGQLPQARYDVAMASTAFNPTDLLPVRQCAALLDAQAMLAAEESRGDDAMDALLSMMALARSLESWPASAACSQRFSIANMVVHRLERVLSYSRPSAAMLERLAQAAGRSCSSAPVERALVGEGVVRYWTLVGQGVGSGSSPLREWMVPQNARRRAEAAMRLHLTCAQVVRQTPIDALPARMSETDEWTGTPQGIMLHYVMHAGRMRLLETVIAIERHRRLVGDLNDEPAMLADLPTNPFDGRPFKYVRRPDRYTVSCDVAAPGRENVPPLSMTVILSRQGR
jgi:hypothetical protein